MLLIALTTACDDAPPAPVTPVKKAAAPAPFKQGKIPMFLALDSQRWPINSATATALSDDMIEVRVSQRERGCEPAAQAEPPAIALTMVREIGADSWRITKVAAKTASIAGEERFALAEAPPAKLLSRDPDGGVTVRIDTNLPIATGGGGNVRLEIHGQIPAKGCGSPPPAGGEEQKNLALSVGGEKLVVRSAQIAPDPGTAGYRLELATSPSPCGDLSAAEIGLTLAIDRLGKNATSIALSGLRAGREQQADLRAGAVRVGLRGAGKAIDVSLNGTAAVGERPVELRGMVRAAMCPASAASGEQGPGR